MRNELDNEIRYRLLKLLDAHPDWNQRQLAKSTGVSLGKLNYCLRALIERGFVKVSRFANNPHKFGYLYLLTPKGILEKARVSASFLEFKEREFELIRREIELLRHELSQEIKEFR